jgi:transcriptional regulator with XRE-family HTH domain
MLSDKIDLLDVYNPAVLAKFLSARLRERRLKHNLSQEALAARSGVSLGTLKRFESKGHISLKHLLMLAVVLKAGEEFTALFPDEPYESIDDLLQKQQEIKRKRGRKKF